MFLKVFIYIVHIIGKRLHRLPRKSDAYGQGEVERMFCAVCFNLCPRWNVVMQAWFCEQPNVGREIEFQAKTCSNRPLPWGVDGGLVGCFQHAVQVVTCAERRVERYLRGNAETSVEAPRLSIIYIIDALHGDAEIVDGLLLIDSITI